MSSGPPGHTSPRRSARGRSRPGSAGPESSSPRLPSARPTRRARPRRSGRSSAEHRATTSVGSGVRRFRPIATATFSPGATVPSPSSMRTARASHGRRSTPISTPACAGVRCGPSRTATIGTRTSWPPARSTRLEPVGASIRARARPVRPEPSLQPPSGRRSAPPGDPAGQASASITRPPVSSRTSPESAPVEGIAAGTDQSSSTVRRTAGASSPGARPGGIARAIVPPRRTSQANQEVRLPLRMRKTNLLGPMGHAHARLLASVSFPRRLPRDFHGLAKHL